MVAHPADATLLIRKGCPHCASVAEALLRLTKAGKLARLEVVNLDQRPEPARALGVRSVPWLKLGPFELIGARSLQELEEWAEHAASGTGWPEYLIELLAEQQLPQVVTLLKAKPQFLSALLDRMADEQLEMGVRIGISAAVEDLAATPALRACVPQLIELTLSAHPQTRADACHFLGLAGDDSAAPAVRRLLQDEHEDVREIALETLAILDGSEQPEEGAR